MPGNNVIDHDQDQDHSILIRLLKQIIIELRSTFQKETPAFTVMYIWLDIYTKHKMIWNNKIYSDKML